MFQLKARNSLRALFVVTAALFATSPSATFAQAANNFVPPPEFLTAPDNLKTKYLIGLINRGQANDAEQLLLQYPLQDGYAANRTLFLEGMILRAQGDLTGAAKKFRKVLANDPSLTLVRAELAKTLVSLDQDDSAKHHLQLLAADAPDQVQASAIKSFIDQVDAKRPFTFNGYIAAAPSSNLNSASKHEKIYLGGSGQQVSLAPNAKDSGVGVVGGVSGAYSKRLGNKFVAVVAGGANAKIYKDDSYNQISTSETVDLRYMTDTGYMGLGIVGSQSFGTSDIKPNYVSVGPRVSVSHALGQRDHLNASVAYELREYQDDMQDGTAFLADVSLTHTIDSTFNFSLLGSFQSVKTDEKSFGYDTWSTGFGLYKELTAGLTVDAQTLFMHTTFDDLHSPIFPRIREDDRIVTSVGLTKRDFNILGLAPSLNYTYTHNTSNIDLYDFNSHAVDIRLTKKF